MAGEFDGRVALVTGAGNGLGRSHAKALAAAGAKVVVNDLGIGEPGSLRPSEAAVGVANEITVSRGIAVADHADVSDMAQVSALVARIMERWGRIDILVNNAGLLRDKTFEKMDMADFRRVIDVHLMGSVHCTKAVWSIMRAQTYGRIVLTTSSSGLYGNFGQSNYGAAKAAMVGLMNVLHHEGGKHGIRVNCLSPTAITQMTKGLVSEEDAHCLTPESVSPAVLYLAGENAPSKMILGAGAGVFAAIHVLESRGVYIPEASRDAAGIAQRRSEIAALGGAEAIDSAFGQTGKYVAMARSATVRPEGKT